MAVFSNYELWYTSAPRGLYAGSAGFSVVKATTGMPGPLRQTLESLCNYRHLYPPNDARAKDNPHGVSCLSVSSAGQRWMVLSRMCDAGLDHTQRTNFFAHHLAIAAHAATTVDPCWLAFQSGLLAEAWDYRTEEIPAARVIPAGSEPLRPCSSWQAMCGDAGWAGRAAQALAENANVTLVFEPGQHVAQLVREVYGLLPLSTRSRIGFSTYFCGLPPGVDCRLRCVLKGSAETRAPRAGGELLLDVSQSLGAAPDSPWAEVARTGRQAVSPSPRRVPGGEPLPLAPVPDDEVEYPLAGTAPTQQPTARPAALAPGRPRALPSARPASPASAQATEYAPPEPVNWATWLIAGALGGVLLGAGGMTPFYLSQRSQLREEERSHELSKVSLAAVTEAKRKLDADLAQANAQTADRDKALADVRMKKEDAEKRFERVATSETEQSRELNKAKAELERLSKQRDADVEALEQERNQLRDGNKAKDETIASLNGENDKLKLELKEARKAASQPINIPVPILHSPGNIDRTDLKPTTNSLPREIKLQGEPEDVSIEKSEENKRPVWILKARQDNDWIPVGTIRIDTRKMDKNEYVIFFNWKKRAEEFPSLDERLAKSSVLKVTLENEKSVEIPLRK